VLIGAAMLVRGVGVGLAIMPAMTAAFSALSREQVNDASPQLTVLQRVGGSLGTAIFAVVLQAQLKHAHTAGAAAAGFGHTYWWIMGFTLLALLPTVLLARIERRHTPRRAEPASALTDADAPLLEAA
jgi:uncharacterized membrane protein